MATQNCRRLIFGKSSLNTVHMVPRISRSENSSVLVFSYRKSPIKLDEISWVGTKFFLYMYLKKKKILVFQLENSSTRTNPVLYILMIFLSLNKNKFFRKMSELFTKNVLN